MNADIVLNNGVKMPAIGLGTFRSRGADVQQAVKAAVQNGIRAIDTASIYKNEEDIRTALAGNSDIFLTSKISPYEQGVKSLPAFEAIIDRLGRVDLLLLHWPGSSKCPPASSRNLHNRHESWHTMEGLYRTGRVRAIGVSNFGVHHLQELLKYAEVVPAVNQVEVHPCYQQRELRRFCKDHGIVVTAYASLGVGALLTRPEVLEAAKQHSKSAAQVLLKWGLQSGCTVIPKSVRPDRIAEYSEEQLLGWQLSDVAFKHLNEMPQLPKMCWDPTGIA